VSYWLDNVDLGHGAPANSPPSAPAPGLAPAAPHTVAAARYLVLATDVFWALYDATCGLMRGLDISDPAVTCAGRRP